MATVDELLRDLGAQSAADVTVGPLPPAAASSSERAARAAAQHRSDAERRGQCVATCGGTSQVVSGADAAVLVAAGAKDER